MILRDLKIEMANCSASNVFEDNVMTVHYVPIVKTHVDESVVIEYDTVKQGNNGPPTQTANTAVDLNKAIQAEYESVSFYIT